MRIEDPLLAPWIIVVEDDHNYVLCQEKEYERKDGEKYSQQQNASYFYDLASLLKKLIKIKFKESEKTLGLEEALQRYQEITNLVTSKLKILE